MPDSIPYAQAVKNFGPGGQRPLPGKEMATEDLLRAYHPDYATDSLVTLKVGPNKGEECHRDLAELLQADARIDEADLAGATVVDTDVLVVGGGGAGCAAALTASNNGARVILATKLRLVRSNTGMAEGGIQASIDKDDTPQMHFDDTMNAGHNRADKTLVAKMVMDGPDVIRWLIQQGMQFDLDEFGDLIMRRAGGTSANRVVYYRDYTGLEMMRALREAVLNSKVERWDYSPAVELITNESGYCAGAVISSLKRCRYILVKAQAVIMATGGIGRLHLNGFPTTNHFGATADGLVMAYRLGARLRDLESYQYHPTGLAHPRHLAGTLITEGIRSAGAQLVNGLGERFVDELRSRDHVSAAILRECAESRGIRIDEDMMGVWLDTPCAERREPGVIAARFPKLVQLGKKSGIDPVTSPLLVFPTLHYQNGGVVIDENGLTSVPGLYCVGEASGGIHGKNRIMGNALLEIISFGRSAGAAAAEHSYGRGHKKISIEHLSQRRRELTLAGMPLDQKSPKLFPDCAKFDKDSDYDGLRVTGNTGMAKK